VRSLNHKALLTLAALLAIAPAASPSDWTSLVKDKALADFSEQDVQDYLKVVNTLLDTPQPTAPVEWSSQQTGVGARLEVIGEPQVAGFSECRRVRTNVYSPKHKAMTRTWTACRDKDGVWSLTKGS
jgi:surface antigen